jgi:hypothetical protein
MHQLKFLFLLFPICIVNKDFSDFSQSKIEAVEVSSSSPIFPNTFYRIFHVNSFIIYQSQYFYSFSTSKANANTDTFETVNDYSEVRYKFFVFHKDSSYGYQYDDKDDKKPKLRLPVDSAVRLIIGTNNLE